MHGEDTFTGSNSQITDYTLPVYQRFSDMERPDVTRETVAVVINSAFGLTVEDTSPLASYDDVNVLVHVTDATENPYVKSVAKTGYVLKILNSVDTQKTEFIGMLSIFALHIHLCKLLV